MLAMWKMRADRCRLASSLIPAHGCEVPDLRGALGWWQWAAVDREGQDIRKEVRRGHK